MDDIENELIAIRDEFIVLNREIVTVIAVYVLGIMLGLYIGLRWGHGA